jgi:hypothetical protein
MESLLGDERLVSPQASGHKDVRGFIESKGYVFKDYYEIVECVEACGLWDVKYIRPGFLVRFMREKFNSVGQCPCDDWSAPLFLGTECYNIIREQEALQARQEDDRWRQLV